MMTINLLLGIAQAGEQAVRRRNAIARRRALTESFRRVRVDREIEHCMRESARVLLAPSALAGLFAGYYYQHPVPVLDVDTANPGMPQWPTYG